MRDMAAISDKVLLGVESVSKKFCRNLKRSLWYGVQDIAGELFGRNSVKANLRPGEFWALGDISFDLRRGERLGVIGPNGAGKSTLLKLLNGLIKPDEGRITVRGRVGALIELGAGFSPILTGRENIYVNAAVLGISKKQVDQIIDQIIDFSELHDFIDTPIQSYSSGMRVRLGFSVAIHMEPDILLVDEVLSVGDLAFQRKSLQRMTQLFKKGTTIIFVSHNMRFVQDLCDRTLFLDHGTVQAFGPTPEAIKAYIDSTRRGIVKRKPEKNGNVYQPGGEKADVVVTNVSIVNEAGQSAQAVEMGQDLNVDIHYVCRRPISTADFQVTLYTKDGVTVRCFNTKFSGVRIELRERNIVRFQIKDLPLMPGSYVLRGSVLDAETGIPYDVWGTQDGRFVEFDVLTARMGESQVVAWGNLGIVSIPHKWINRVKK